MPTLESLLAMFGAAVLLAFSPGPDNLFVLSQAALRGRKAGWLITLGLCTGLFVHIALVVFGVAALIQQSELAFRLLRLLGASYLLYLAWKSWPASALEFGEGSGGQASLSSGQLYRRGILMNVTNPKVTLFFLALLPTFVEEERGYVAGQLIAFGAVFQLVTLLVFGGIAALAGSLGPLLQRRPVWQLRMNRLAALLFVGLAAYLLKDLFIAQK